MHQSLNYKTIIQSQIEHITSAYLRLNRLHYPDVSKVYFMTATFLPHREKCNDILVLKPSRCFCQFEKFYVHMLSRLMTNPTRRSKRHLQPLTYAYIDYPFHETSPSQTNPHVHAVMLVHPKLVPVFDDKMTTFQSLFQGLNKMNMTLHTQQARSIEDVMSYSSKFLTKRRFHQEIKNEELYIMLPKSRREPAYARNRK